MFSLKVVYVNLTYIKLNSYITCLLSYCGRGGGQKHSKQNKTTTTQEHMAKIIDNISFTPMKQFNLFPVARGMLTVTHDQNIIYKLQVNTYIYNAVAKNPRGRGPAPPPLEMLKV